MRYRTARTTSAPCILPQVLFRLAKEKQRDGGGVISCWSCGCSTGEEAYGLRLLWCNRLRKYFRGVDLSVLGTDAEEQNIQGAQRAVYKQYSVEDVPLRWLEKDFQRDRSSASYSLLPASRARVTFERQDVLQALPSGLFDVILCRYAMCLYFSPQQTWDTLVGMVKHLNPGGYLVVGAQVLPPALACLSEAAPKERLPPGFERLGLSDLCAECPGVYAKARSAEPVSGAAVGASSPLAHSSLRAFLYKAPCGRPKGGTAHVGGGVRVIAAHVQRPHCPVLAGTAASADLDRPAAGGRGQAPAH